MTVQEALTELESYVNPNGKKVLMRHGAREPFWGVRIGDMKKIVRKIKTDHKLALELYETGNTDAMYLAGLIADEHEVTKDQLRVWVKQAYWYMLSEGTVASLTAESPYGWDLGIEWIDGSDEMTRTAGWATLGGVISYLPNDSLEIGKISELLDRVERDIHNSENRVRYSMNNFVICAGAYIGQLTEKAHSVASSIGTVTVDMGDTSCKVPYAPDYIRKSIAHGSLEKKKKSVRC
jgi:3-methyladenine DNA glycosylase AlkD